MRGWGVRGGESGEGEAGGECGAVGEWGHGKNERVGVGGK